MFICFVERILLCVVKILFEKNEKIMNKYLILLLKIICKFYIKCRNNFGEYCLSYEINLDIVFE